MGAADAMVDFLLLAGVFGFTRRGNFRDRVNAHRQHRSDALLILKAEGMADGDAALFHRSGRQSGEADDVARSVNVWDGGTIIFIDGDITTVVDGEAGLFESEAIDGGAAARGKKRGIRFQNLSRLHRQLRSSHGILHFHGAFVEPEIHAKFGKAVSETIRNFRIEKW